MKLPDLPETDADAADSWYYTVDQMHAYIAPVLAERDALREQVRVLREALSAMLTHMGMDEDEWNKPTYDKARFALRR